VNDLRQAWRGMSRAPWVTGAVIVILAVGIGVNSALLSYVRGLTALAGVGIPSSPDLVHVVFRRAGERPGNPPAPVSYRAFSEMQRNISGAKIAGWATRRSGVATGANTRVMTVTAVTANYFSVLGLRPLKGTLYMTPGDGPDETPSAVISERLWESAFERRADVIGQAMRVQGVPLTIVGVVPAPFGGMYRESADVWMPLTTQQLATVTSPSSYARAERDSLYLDALIARTHGAVSPAALAMAFEREANRLLPPRTGKEGAWQSTIERARILTDPRAGGTADTWQAVAMLGSISLLLLALSCGSAGALMLGRAASRRHEIAMRFCFGASRAQVLKVLLIESVCMAIAAAIASLVVLAYTREHLYTATRDILPVHLPLDAAVALGAVLLAVGVGIAFGTAPALHASRASIADVLKSSESGGRLRLRIQRALVITQVTLSLTILVGALVPISTLLIVKPWMLGITDGARVITATLHFDVRSGTREAGQRTLRRLRELVGGLPGVEAVSFATRVPLVAEDITTGTQIEVFTSVRGDADAPSATFVAHVLAVEPNFFATIGQRLVSGRDFTGHDTLSRGAVVILPSDVARRIWPGENPVGQQLRRPMSNLATATVVGVVSPTKSGLTDGKAALVYLPQNASPDQAILMLVRTTGPATTLVPLVARTLGSVDAELPITGVQTLAVAVQESLRLVTRVSLGAMVLALFSLSLCAAGMAGIVMFTVSQRSKEFAIRMALGATPTQVRLMMLRQQLRLVAYGAIVAAPMVTIILSTALRVGGSAEIAIAVLVTAGAVIVSVSAVASWIPARRATATAPMRLLQET
jgi:predicted permease